MEEKINVFCTNVFELVAFLALKGHKFQVQKEVGKPTFFIFDKNIELIESLAREFNNGSYSLMYANKLKEIKMIAIDRYQKGYYTKKQ